MQSGSTLHQRVLVLVLVGGIVLALAQIGAGIFGTRAPLASAETRFVETSASGLAIVPASCPSSPHYNLECSCEGSGAITGYDPTRPWCGQTTSCANGLNKTQYPSCTCPVGQHAVSGMCICDTTGLPSNIDGQCTTPVCPTGSQYDPTTGRCIVIGECARPPICSDSTRVLNQCTGQTINCAANGPGWSCQNGGCQRPPPPLASISAVPSLVAPGRTANIAWTSTNTSACSVTGNNGDGPWSGTSGSHVSAAISTQVVYTLSCTGFDGATIMRTATVNIIPNWVEN